VATRLKNLMALYIMQEKANGIKILKKYIALKLATIWLRNIRRITKKKMKYPNNFGQPVVPFLETLFRK
jgi:hypothetical protein